MTTVLKASDAPLGAAKGDHTIPITSDEIVNLLKQYGLLSQLVREVIIDSTIAEFELTPEETMQAYKQFYQQHKLNDEADLQAWLEARGLERKHLNHLATRNIKLERFKKSAWTDKLDSHFIQRKAHLDQVIYSLIRVNDIGLSQELYFRIQEGEQSFSELAREFSQGPESQTGGLLGPMELGNIHPMLANILASSQPGHLLPPTRLGEWIIIIRLEKFFPARLDESIQQRLINEMFENWLHNQVNSQNSYGTRVSKLLHSNL